MFHLKRLECRAEMVTSMLGGVVLPDVAIMAVKGGHVSGAQTVLTWGRCLTLPIWLSRAASSRNVEQTTDLNSSRGALPDLADMAVKGGLVAKSEGHSAPHGQSTMWKA